MDTTPQINTERLASIVALKSGAHDENDGASMCAMEAAAWIAGEPWSDHPKCVCPVISAFMRSWNDSLPDDRRTELLLPLIPATIGTRGSDALANRRATMATDWLIRVHTPAWLRLAGLTKQADSLSSLPEITDFAKTPGLLPTLQAVRDDAAAAWAAARAAAWAAAWDAAWAAARAAARAAAGAAAGAAAWAAAWDAAGAAAWAAAWDGAGAAARAAAWAAAGDALAQTVADLQLSAADVVKRMCALHEDA